MHFNINKLLNQAAKKLIYIYFELLNFVMRACNNQNCRIIIAFKEVIYFLLSDILIIKCSA